MFRKTAAALAWQALLCMPCTAVQVASPASAAPAIAALGCANPALPQAILDGSPVAVPARRLPTIAVHAPRARLTLAVVADTHNRELGLMCVTRLRRHAGMIFVFDQSYDWEFWMKNTLIPLDMIWLENDGTVTTIAPHVPASTMTTADEDLARRRGHGRYVIELNAGEAAQDGIKVGGRLPLRLP